MRLPRVRFTVRRMMVAVAVLAVASAGLAMAFAGWTRVGPHHWRQHLDTEMTWSRSPVGRFFVKHELEEYSANSLLKVSDLGAPDREGHFTGHRWCLGPGGQLLAETRSHYALGWGSGWGQHYLTAAKMAEVQQIILKLPLSNESYLQRDRLLVSSFKNGSWVTNIYDKAALPPAVQDLVSVLKLRFR